jgi:hypothetical protein
MKSVLALLENGHEGHKENRFNFRSRIALPFGKAA